MLARFSATNFRNLTTNVLEFEPATLHYFYGKNGSGKTSLLEAIYYMIHGKSFRTKCLKNIITHQKNTLAINAQFILCNQNINFPLQIKKSLAKKVQINAAFKEITTFSKLITYFPTLLAHSASYQLLDSSSATRRKYIDWGSFYLDTNFINIWKKYTKALRQRNALLRNQIHGTEFKIWTDELIKTGNQLNNARIEFTEKLHPFLIRSVKKLIHIPELSIAYHSGWPEKLNLEQALAKTQQQERLLRSTQVGPHRADFNFLINNIKINNVLSRGQQKLFIYAMLVAQGELIKTAIKTTPIYLLDDFAAELDTENGVKTIELLHEQGTQIFVTGIEKREQLTKKMQLFHVEHGKIKRGN